MLRQESLKVKVELWLRPRHFFSRFFVYSPFFLLAEAFLGFAIFPLQKDYFHPFGCVLGCLHVRVVDWRFRQWPKQHHVKQTSTDIFGSWKKNDKCIFRCIRKRNRITQHKIFGETFSEKTKFSFNFFCNISWTKWRVNNETWSI